MILNAGIANGKFVSCICFFFDNKIDTIFSGLPVVTWSFTLKTDSASLIGSNIIGIDWNVFAVFDIVPDYLKSSVFFGFGVGKSCLAVDNRCVRFKNSLRGSD